MNQNPGIDAVMSLANMGYRFTVNGGTIKAKYQGPGKPDPEKVRPLMEVMKEHKPQVLSYLVQTQEASDRILTCFECGFFRPAVNSPNPTQAFGRCQKREKGRYGCATACEAIMSSSGAPGEAIPMGDNP
jgi:hypothetical protein